MRVLHVCVSGPFTDGLSYQENELIEQHVALGHDVTVIAAISTYGENQQITDAKVGQSKLRCGATLIRLSYAWGLKGWLPSKIRAYSGLRECLEEIRPDRILFHGLTAWSLLTVSKFVKCNPQVSMFADSHEDWYNSARTVLSKWLLHYCFYRPILRRCLPYIKKVLCCSLETIDFVKSLYGVPQSQIEFYPLGGILWDDVDYSTTRTKTRESQGWLSQHRVFLQSGKLDRAKRLGDTLRAFANLDDANLRLVITGRIMPDVQDEVLPLIMADNRVQVLGWVDSKKLRNLLCAADVYVQPGSQSATMQMALCCRRPVIIADVMSHKIFIKGNGTLVSGEDQLRKAMETLAQLPDEKLLHMSHCSAQVAAQLLDYRKQAMRVTESF